MAEVNMAGLIIAIVSIGLFIAGATYMREAQKEAGSAGDKAFGTFIGVIMFFGGIAGVLTGIGIMVSSG
jgi:hypothetical protein